MMDESEIRQRFAQLREADRERAPSFAQIYGRGRARRRLGAMPRVRPLVIGAAAAVVIAAVWIANARPFSPLFAHADDRGHRSMARADGRSPPDSRQRAARHDARARRVRARQNDFYTFEQRNLTMRRSILALAFVLGAATLGAQGQPMGQPMGDNALKDPAQAMIGAKLLSSGAGDAAPE